MAGTKLKAPLEFIKVHFLVEGVSRSFTHQMVRQRTAVFAQESLRFAVKEGFNSDSAKLPPSIARLKEDDPRRVQWEYAMDTIGAIYGQLVDGGVPAEDARELLPSGTLTRLHYATDFRNLLEHAGNRLCTQAQFEWRQVLSRLAAAIREYGRDQVYPVVVSADEAPSGIPGDDEPLDVIRSSAWQFDALAGLFRPACYLTGKCEFSAQDLDRACKIRDRVDANHEHGRPSSEWGEDYAEHRAGQLVEIPPIRPEEWLLDDAAARVRPS
jgi:flavin-dependent thymidylate synthase